MKTVSVIVPCYNQAKYLSETLQSVLNQTYSYWECLIVNDGSPDETKEVAEKWCNADSRFKYIEKENGGLSSARNKGIMHAQGDYIQFLDSDDVIHPEKFEKQINGSSENVGVLISMYHLFKHDVSQSYQQSWNEYKMNNLLEDVLYRWDNHFVIPIHAALFQRDYFSKYGILFREDLNAKEDWVFWIECLKRNNSYILQSEVLAYYRVHEKSMTANRVFMMQNERKAHFLVYDLLNDEEKEPFVQRKLNHFIGNLVEEYITIKRRNEKLSKKRSKYKYLFIVSLVALIATSLLLYFKFIQV